ncbi:hypothetical protein LG200_05085 [Methylobacillus caricis]|uniref:hypothetical protein n=1 Tax=Methylobacillus caricis TaxID=1971611 RepID=UPI001CFF6279|nr:hypothetical protein [Methylobacillus caricis]MCB5187378.1 hypothetical protein [Methylobacillus caricis]
MGFRKLPEVLENSLEMYLHRGAQEAARLMREKSPKAFTTNANSILAEKSGRLQYIVAPHMNYSGFLEDGTKPHLPPAKALQPWVERVLGLRENAAYRAARAIAWKISKTGTKAKPYIQPTADEIEPRFMTLMEQGLDAGIKDAFL